MKVIRAEGMGAITDRLRKMARAGRESQCSSTHCPPIVIRESTTMRNKKVQRSALVGGWEM